ncbi:MAG: PQQ-dependent sugar dehydrogenase [Nitriliruptoraceae bacterium]
MRGRRGIVATLLGALLALAACGPEARDVRADPPSLTEPDGSAPATGEPGGGEPAGEGAGDDASADDEPATDAGSGDDPTPADAPEPDVDLDVALVLEPVVTMDSPVAGALAPDGTLYLGDRSGTVHELTADGLSAPVLDLSDETTTESERGLLGLAVAADGSHLYVSSTDRAGSSVLTAVPRVDGELRPAERRTFFRLEQPYPNHNGGDLHVGPDGFLYYGLGDGGGAGDPLEAGQDLTTPLGALLRLDPQGGDPYAVPADNPFLDLEGAAPEIVAYGLRNPWRFSFDAETDEVWIADVGQDRWEEITRIPFAELPGANLGWNLMEGREPFAGEEPEDHVPPVYTYATRGPEGCAVTGGVVYRGQAIPELDGVYLYADSCTGVVRGLVVDEAGELVEQASLGVDGGQVVAFVVDPEGEVLVLDLEGAVRRLVPA